MHYFKASDLSLKDKKKKLSGSVIPRPIALVLTQSESVINVAPFSYFNIVSNNPPIVSVSVQRLNGELKDTSRNILENRQATVHIVTESIVEEANKTSAPFASDVSELDHASFTLIDSVDIETPGIKEADVCYETTLYNHLEIKDNEGIVTADLLLLEVVAFHISEEVYDSDKEYIIADKLQAVSRLAGADYAKVGEQFALVRPE